ncbi:dTDP-4-dehydrorhamnose reductase [Terriglobus sp. TAA 43]|uniref:dTDP-4-dehydrorhamnose reductase n=1 Tax=Terriglobus sp. TAA 43 TaxID=278961 RepID=UPI0006491E2B|nr:dTDP-4-dehydrorhamnose reductase [Terriglobus sp. TAA 43]
MTSAAPILVTGASGQVGGEVVSLLRLRNQSILAPTSTEMNLASPDAIRAYVRKHRPAWIINAAAYTAVDKAESEVELAEAINAVAPGVLGEEAAILHIPVIHFSTDYVFAGDGLKPWVETDATGPLSTYGRTKLEGEQALANSGAAYMIFRTSWVYGATGKNFFRTILRVARERESMSIVADQFGAPTWARDLARLALFVIDKAGSNAEDAVRHLGGHYHACNGGETTWFGFAEEILRQAAHYEPNVKFATLHPVPTEAYPTPAKRPANSRMNCSLLATKLAFQMPDWRESLAQVISEYDQLRVTGSL